MGTRLLLLAGALCCALAFPAGAAAARDDARYALAGGCYRITSGGTPVAADHGPFRMQATALGRYLIYGKGADFLAGTGGDAVGFATSASEAANWRVDVAGGGFAVTLPSAGKALAAGEDGRLSLAGTPTPLMFEKAEGCAVYPEVETNATGTPARGKTPFGEVRGYLDAHMHQMAFEFLGGRAHCGRPWSPYGAPYALVDCPDHYPNGTAAILENVLSFGDPLHTHDPVGWPTFKDWPHHSSLTHEQSYYKWLERSWRGGQRIFVNLLVENKVLCTVYPFKQNSCDEMDAVRLQARRMRELEDYIDAQSGGPGKGWYRIVTDPFQARRVINDGKLAVVMGIEVSEPFGCQLFNDRPQCDEKDIDRGLDEVYDLGVRDMEIINKFDNALGGVAADNGTTGVIVNQGNLLTTGKYWQMETCTGPADEADKLQFTPFGGHNHDDLISNGLAALLPQGSTPLYPAGPHCNVRGLSSLGEHLIRRMMRKRMIVDPDHLSVLARKQVLSLLESERYPGIVSSHSWSTPDANPRIYRLGGVIAPYAGGSAGFVKAWKDIKPKRDRRFYFGFGWGADMNGFGSQGGPRVGASNPVRYPFKSFDGKVTLDRNRSGSRVWDINVDGVAHYGLYPDWVEDLRMQAGDEIVEDLARGAEAYLQMWERTVGVPAAGTLPRRAALTARGLGRLRVGASVRQLLLAGGQPARRPGRVWTYRVRGGGRAVAVLTPRGRVALIASTARLHRAGKARPGDRARGTALRVAGRLVTLTRRGRVRAVAVGSREVVRDRATLRRYLRLAGV